LKAGGRFSMKASDALAVVLAAAERALGVALEVELLLQRVLPRKRTGCA
jgi:hypothetical protein